MKLLFIGGTGLLSSACSDLALQRGHELFLLNRTVSTKYPAPKAAAVLQADIHADSTHPAALLAGHRFDAVVDFIAFTADDVERDISLFRDKTINLYSSVPPLVDVWPLANPILRRLLAPSVDGD